MTPQLRHESTMALIRAAQCGDDHAFAVLIDDNVALVKSVVRRFAERSVEYDDLFQLGCMGLVKAIRNFNTQLDLRLSTYAVPLIAGEIRRHIRDNGQVHIARSIKQNATRVRRCAEEMQGELGREPTLQEVAERLSLSCEDALLAMESLRPVRSLNEPLSEGQGADGLTLADTLAQPPETGPEDRLALKAMLQALPVRDRQVVVERYYKDRTQSEIAQRLGLSQAQVSRIEKRVLESLRRQMEEAG